MLQPEAASYDVERSSLKGGLTKPLPKSVLRRTWPRANADCRCALLQCWRRLCSAMWAAGSSAHKNEGRCCQEAYQCADRQYGSRVEDRDGETPITWPNGQDPALVVVQPQLAEDQQDGGQDEAPPQTRPDRTLFSLEAVAFIYSAYFLANRGPLPPERETKRSVLALPCKTPPSKPKACQSTEHQCVRLGLGDWRHRPAMSCIEGLCAARGVCNTRGQANQVVAEVAAEPLSLGLQDIDLV